MGFDFDKYNSNISRLQSYKPGTREWDARIKEDLYQAKLHAPFHVTEMAFDETTFGICKKFAEKEREKYFWQIMGSCCLPEDKIAKWAHLMGDKKYKKE